VDGVPHSVGHQRSTHRSRGLIGWRCIISCILGSHHCSLNSTAINWPHAPHRAESATEVVNGWSLGYTFDSPDEVQLGRCNLATF
jgi:hypothetical protein